MASEYYYHAMAWLVLVPVAFIFICLALVAIGYYRSAYRSIDCFFLSLLVTLLMNACVVVVIQAVLFIADLPWNRILCQVFVWCCVTFRMAAIFTASALSLDRVLIVRLPGKYRHYCSVKTKAFVFLIWLFAALLGTIPIIGWTTFDFSHRNAADDCPYMSFEIDHGFGVFIIVLELTLFFLSVVCLIDVLFHMRYISRNAIISMKPASSKSSLALDRNAAGGHVFRARSPAGSSGTLRTSSVDLLPDMFVEDSSGRRIPLFHGSMDLVMAYDSCRIACIVVVAIYVLNHLPYTVLSIIGVLLRHRSVSYRVAALWFVLAEALVLPHVLWMWNKRYRAGVKHVGKMLICSEPMCSTEEDVYGVKLESYRIQEGRTSMNRRLAAYGANPRLMAGATFHRKPSHPVYRQNRMGFSPYRIASEPMLQHGGDSDHESEDSTELIYRTYSLDAYINALEQSDKRARLEPTMGQRSLRLEELAWAGRHEDEHDDEHEHGHEHDDVFLEDPQPSTSSHRTGRRSPGIQLDELSWAGDSDVTDTGSPAHPSTSMTSVYREHSHGSRGRTSVAGSGRSGHSNPGTVSKTATMVVHRYPSTDSTLSDRTRRSLAKHVNSAHSTLSGGSRYSQHHKAGKSADAASMGKADWKERMRKKHMPDEYVDEADYVVSHVNEAFQAELDLDPDNTLGSEDMTGFDHHYHTSATLAVDDYNRNNGNSHTSGHVLTINKTDQQKLIAEGNQKLRTLSDDSIASGLPYGDDDITGVLEDGEVLDFVTNNPTFDGGDDDDGRISGRQSHRSSHHSHKSLRPSIRSGQHSNRSSRHSLRSGIHSIGSSRQSGRSSIHSNKSSERQRAASSGQSHRSSQRSERSHHRGSSPALSALYQTEHVSQRVYDSHSVDRASVVPSDLLYEHPGLRRDEQVAGVQEILVHNDHQRDSIYTLGSSRSTTPQHQENTVKTSPSIQEFYSLSKVTSYDVSPPRPLTPLPPESPKSLQRLNSHEIDWPSPEEGGNENSDDSNTDREMSYDVTQGTFQGPFGSAEQFEPLPGLLEHHVFTERPMRDGDRDSFLSKKTSRASSRRSSFKPNLGSNRSSLREAYRRQRTGSVETDSTEDHPSLENADHAAVHRISYETGSPGATLPSGATYETGNSSAPLPRGPSYDFWSVDPRFPQYLTDDLQWKLRESLVDPEGSDFVGNPDLETYINSIGRGRVLGTYPQDSLQDLTDPDLEHEHPNTWKAYETGML